MMRILINNLQFWVTNSGGIFALNYLGHLCAQHGHEVFMPFSTNPEWAHHIRVHKGEEVDIVIRPETDCDTCEKTVRWVLNVPGKLGGPTQYADHEMVWWFERALKDHAFNAHKSPSGMLFLPSINLHEWDCGNVEKEELAAFYIGKDYIFHDRPWRSLVPEPSIEISRGWPREKRDLAKLIRKVKRFYSFDDYSGLNNEAFLFGCEVFIYDGSGWIKYVPPMFPVDYVVDYKRDYATVGRFISKVKEHFKLERET